MLSVVPRGGLHDGDRETDRRTMSESCVRCGAPFDQPLADYYRTYGAAAGPALCRACRDAPSAPQQPVAQASPAWGSPQAPAYAAPQAPQQQPRAQQPATAPATAPAAGAWAYTPAAGAPPPAAPAWGAPPASAQPPLAQPAWGSTEPSAPAAAPPAPAPAPPPDVMAYAAANPAPAPAAAAPMPAPAFTAKPAPTAAAHDDADANEEDEPDATESQKAKAPKRRGPQRGGGKRRPVTKSSHGLRPGGRKTASSMHARGGGRFSPSQPELNAAVIIGAVLDFFVGMGVGVLGVITLTAGALFQAGVSASPDPVDPRVGDLATVVVAIGALWTIGGLAHLIAGIALLVRASWSRLVQYAVSGIFGALALISMALSFNVITVMVVIGFALPAGLVAAGSSGGRSRRRDYGAPPRRGGRRRP